MKQTPLSALHHSLGARMTEFAGYNMPVVYTTITEEHLAVRENVGIFDVSHMGEFILKGQHALDLIQKISSNDASKLEIGQAQYCCMPNKNGGIVDDLIVYRLSEEKCSDGERAYMLVVNASNIEKDWNWISSQNDMDVRMQNISDRSSLLAVQGPKAAALLQDLTQVNLAEIAFYHFTKGTIAGVENVLISATGYTGSGGFELYVDNQNALKLWKAIMTAGEAYDLKPCGLGARDTLRLEMGYCLYGNDIDDTTSPLEAGLGWITKLKKMEDFNSKALFIDQKSEGIQNKLVGFTLQERRVPRQGYKLFSKEDIEIGYVTSGTQSPSMGIPIGLGYVKKEFAVLGNEILVEAGKKKLVATITKTPFYKI